MTKAEIIKTIEGSMKGQKEAVSVVNKLLKSVSMSEDTVMLVSVLHTMNGCICDTLNNISLILCEMLPEEAPEKDPGPKMGDHTDACNADCQCMTCVNDNSHDIKDLPCCDKHGFRGCVVHNCPDYVKEG